MSRVSEGVLRVSWETPGGRCKGVPTPIGGHPTYPPSGPAWVSHGIADTLAWVVATRGLGRKPCLAAPDGPKVEPAA
jgi:hypothetical protein